MKRESNLFEKKLEDRNRLLELTFFSLNYGASNEGKRNKT